MYNTSVTLVNCFLNWCRHLVNVLSERSQSRKLEDVSYSSSTLTHLMRESLGGNAKLSVICAISPENKYFPFQLEMLHAFQYYGNSVTYDVHEKLAH